MKFIEDCVDAVFTRIPFWDNYFWQVYLRGTYTPSCCPEYLKEENFARLKAGLLLDTQLSQDQRDFAETIRRSGRALLSIINDILDFSKIEAGKMELEIIGFDLRRAVENVLEILAEPAATKGVELVSLIHAAVPTWVEGDPGRLRQILTNLVGNAIKFTEGGEVVVRVTRAEGEEREHGLYFAVADTGIGLASNVRERLFQAFTQADESTTRKHGGTGLGLAISRRLVEMMHGRIGVESELGQGSTFWFTAQLPMCSAPHDATLPIMPNLYGTRLLCVIDNVSLQTSLERLLGSGALRSTQLPIAGILSRICKHGRPTRCLMT
ncbi:hypothetical protein C2W62_17495 [Candidatus Entotheonella serta]|nr:hypothetical protein C2W62_17495 [Candidatus Entotheonella serta]